MTPNPPPPLTGKWVDAFFGVSDTGKTWRLIVVAKEDGEPLGEIRWYGAWRRYAFFPEPATLFEETCLRDIASFLAQAKATPIIHIGVPDHV